MRRAGEHAQVRLALFPPACSASHRTSLVPRLLRELRRRRLTARVERVTLQDHLAYWKARGWPRWLQLHVRVWRAARGQ